MKANKGKTEVVSVRVAPRVKLALQLAANAEVRSQANMIEVMVLAYCKANEISIPEELSSGDSQAGKA
jgi:hypothetical protein